MILPNIHLGGSNPDTLLAENRNALDALREALRLLRAACPNARDYYLQGSSAGNQALECHNARLKSLYKVERELNVLVMSINDQIADRNARMTG